MKKIFCSSLYRSQHPGCDNVRQFCKMLPLGENQIKGTHNLSVIYLTIALAILAMCQHSVRVFYKAVLPSNKSFVHRSMSHTLRNMDPLIFWKQDMHAFLPVGLPLIFTLMQQSSTFLAPGTDFVEDIFSPWIRCGEDGFEMIQVYYIYCTLCF